MSVRNVTNAEPDNHAFSAPFISFESSDKCKTYQYSMHSPVSSMEFLAESVGQSSLSSSPLSDRSETSFSSGEDGFRTPPQSPRKPAVKITPEKMKQFCLKVSQRPPQPALFPDEEGVEEQNPLLTNWATSDWLNAHESTTKEALNEVITKTRYISHHFFIKQLGQSIAQANSHLANLYGSTYFPGKNCIVLVEEEKSNLWVAELAKEHFGFNAERYMDLGLNGAEQFVKMLRGVSAGMDIVKEKFHNRTIVLFDDASYSGKQISSHLLQLRTVINKYNLAIREIVVIVPFATPYAQMQIREASVARIGKVCKAYISLMEDLPMLSELTPASYDVIVRLWYKGVRADADKIGLACFQHKVPNGQSFPAPLAKGSVYHFGVGGQSQSQKGSYRLLEDVIPDYKGTRAERFSS